MSLENLREVLKAFSCGALHVGGHWELRRPEAQANVALIEIGSRLAELADGHSEKWSV